MPSSYPSSFLPHPIPLSPTPTPTHTQKTPSPTSTATTNKTNHNPTNREDLREQHAIGDEISEAITSGVGPSAIDEDDLDEELAELQQEQLDEQMLNTGAVPVGDKVGRLPQAPQAEIAKGKSAAARVEEDDEEEELRKLQAEMAM